MFVLTDGKDAVGDWQILAGNHCEYTGQCKGLRNVDVPDDCVWKVTAQNLAVEHPRENYVVGELRLSDALRPRVDFAKRFTDNIEWFAVFVTFAHAFKVWISLCLCVLCGSVLKRWSGSVEFDFQHEDTEHVETQSVYSSPYTLSFGSSYSSPRILAAANSTASYIFM